MRTAQAFTAIGQWLARPLKFLLYRWVDGRLAHATLDMRGIDNVRALGGAAFILAANHVQVPNTGPARCGPSPDSFILERLVRETTGQLMRATPLNRIDDNRSMDWLRSKFLRNAIDDVRKGIVLGLGHIPFQHGDPATIRAILHAVERDIIPARRFLLIYPQGQWLPDLSPGDEFQDGTAFLAIRFQLPIVPAYLRGCDSWELSRPVVVSFGAPLRPPPRDRKTFHADIGVLMEQVKAAMLGLREQVVGGALVF